MNTGYYETHYDLWITLDDPNNGLIELKFKANSLMCIGIERSGYKEGGPTYYINLKGSPEPIIITEEQFKELNDIIEKRGDK
jgi:hypothetical protein